MPSEWGCVHSLLADVFLSIYVYKEDLYTIQWHWEWKSKVGHASKSSYFLRSNISGMKSKLVCIKE